MGANLVRLANTRLGAEILRTPGAGEIGTFRSRPQVFGLPILFPPNRIADGRYTFEGRTYRYPITIEKERNYHHGVLKSEAFMVSKARETDEEVMIECRYYANAGNDAVYRDFPHEFKCKITYWLTAEGLEQEVMFSNRSKTRMPLGVGVPHPADDSLRGRDRRRLRDAPRRRGKRSNSTDATSRRDADCRCRRNFPDCAAKDSGSPGASRSRRASRCARSTWTANRSAARWSRTCARV